MVFGFIQNTKRQIAQHLNVLSVIFHVPPANEHQIGTSAKLDCEFMNSSNGLILCLHKKNQKQYKFSIFNPLTNRNISLPMLPKRYSSSSISLICEENPHALSVKYKVFAIKEVTSNYVTMLTFLSETGKWKSSTLTSTLPCSRDLNKLNWRYPFTVNAFIYWDSHGGYIAVYDTNDETCIMQLIESPSRNCLFCSTIDAVRSPGDDSLWLCGRLYETFQLKVWMLPKGEYDSYKRSSTTIPRTKWVVMHDINYEPLYKNIKKKNTQFIIWEWIILKVPHVVLLQCSDRYYICNLENNSFEAIVYPEIIIGHRFSPYFEPLCLSSYAL